ncbi:MAG: M20/M25/M40 family metallo-hydrolase [Methanomassiliicoccales archaeon]|nr:MAG: M20/M25/M40 family metallo-hydrolase [Methanomassiliicoccales archaeon]
MDVIELTKKLVSIESITGNEHEIAEFIASQLNFAEVELQTVGGFGPNVIAETITNPEKPVIILNCHMDTVDIMQGWDSEPLVPGIEGNRMFGLGACDMKAGIAIAMDVFKQADKNGKNLIFTAVSDEEGNSKGAHLLLSKIAEKEGKETLEKGLCLIPEDTQEKIKLGARGRYVVKITVKGLSAHGATPESGTNAIDDAAKIVTALKNLPLKEHPKLQKGSICTLKINGGGDFLSVPERCEITVDRHTVLGEDKIQVAKDFDQLLRNLNLESQYEVSLLERETPFLEPYILDTENLWAQKFQNAYKAFYNIDAEIEYGKSVGDFNAFGGLMPTIVFGPKGENAHGPNECVLVDSIIRCRDFFLEFLNRI